MRNNFVVSNVVKHLDVGRAGENIVADFLARNGFSVIERNYRKRLGEIDIVAMKERILHFVEVKTVSRENNVIRETDEWSEFDPEDNVHAKKRRRMKRIVEIYLDDRNVSHETWYQIDVASVYFNEKTGKSDVDFLEDVVI